jgi:hypothetical protein
MRGIARAMPIFPKPVTIKVMRARSGRHRRTIDPIENGQRFAGVKSASLEIDGSGDWWPTG